MTQELVNKILKTISTDDAIYEWKLVNCGVIDSALSLRIWGRQRISNDPIITPITPSTRLPYLDEQFKFESETSNIVLQKLSNHITRHLNISKTKTQIENIHLWIHNSDSMLGTVIYKINEYNNGYNKFETSRYFVLPPHLELSKLADTKIINTINKSIYSHIEFNKTWMSSMDTKAIEKTLIRIEDIGNISNWKYNSYLMPNIIILKHSTSDNKRTILSILKKLQSGMDTEETRYVKKILGYEYNESLLKEIRLHIFTGFNSGIVCKDRYITLSIVSGNDSSDRFKFILTVAALLKTYQLFK